MNEEHLEIAQENAHKIRNRVIQALPPYLVKKENKLLFRIKKVNGNALKKLAALYSFMDELYSFVAKFTPCKIGCDHCCHIPITVREPEIQFIEKATNIPRSLSILDPEFHWQPCPFLKNSACSIYKYRPFVCRRHMMLCKTSTWCRVGKCNEADFPQLSFSEVDKSYDFIIIESGFPPARDIRYFFNK